MQNQLTVQELDFDELEEVAGGDYDTSISVSTAFVATATGIALVGASPFLAGAFVVGSFVATGFAVYYSFNP